MSKVHRRVRASPFGVLVDESLNDGEKLLHDPRSIGTLDYLRRRQRRTTCERGE